MKCAKILMLPLIPVNFLWNGQAIIIFIHLKVSLFEHVFELNCFVSQPTSPVFKIRGRLVRTLSQEV